MVEDLYGVVSSRLKETPVAVISGGVDTYTDRDGKMQLLNPESASMKLNDVEVFRFDGKLGLLELSMSQTDIDTLIAAHGGLPIAQMQVPAPFEQPVVQNVREIRPLPKKDGTFLMFISRPKPKPVEPVAKKTVTEQKSVRRGWFSWLFG